MNCSGDLGRFRKGHSTEHAILETIDNLKTALDQNMFTCGIFLDFSKAFDTIIGFLLIRPLSVNTPVRE